MTPLKTLFISRISYKDMQRNNHVLFVCLTRVFFFCFFFEQIGTTKGTGGDVLILEEAAYCDPNFFYETLAPILLIDRTSLLAISTLTSEFVMLFLI